jgi:hypothetical protein
VPLYTVRGGAAQPSRYRSSIGSRCCSSATCDPCVSFLDASTSRNRWHPLYTRPTAQLLGSRATAPQQDAQCMSAPPSTGGHYTAVHGSHHFAGGATSKSSSDDELTDGRSTPGGHCGHCAHRTIAASHGAPVQTSARLASACQQFRRNALQRVASLAAAASASACPTGLHAAHPGAHCTSATEAAADQVTSLQAGC